LVGYISSRFGNTDIGLATLNPGIEFRNNFLDLPGAPKTLLHSDDLRLKDVFMIDSFSTGRRSSFQCQGKRFIKEEDKKKRQDPQLKGDLKNLPTARSMPCRILDDASKADRPDTSHSDEI
jgi:hypothetical protein